MTTDLDEYLPAIVAGDPDAFALWLAGAEPQLRQGLRRFAERIDGEAVLQEALLRVWQVAPRYPGDGKPNGLLRLGVRIATNLAVDALRRQRMAPMEIEVLAASADGLDKPSRWNPSDPHLRKIIADCRERLPRRPAQALTARLDSGGSEPDRELAAHLQMRVNTFLQNVTRARRLLADCLRRAGVDLELELS